MMKYLFLLVICCSNFCCWAADGMSVWQRGNSFYKAKQYDSAATCYEVLAKQRVKNPELYFDLGNTYYKQNNVPKAVVNYERAIWLDPGFKQARENLLLTQTRINNRISEVGEIFFIEWWSWLTAANKSNLWAVVSLIIFIAIIAILFVNRSVRATRGAFIPGQIPVLLGLFWIFTTIFAYVATNHASDSELAVVMENDSPMMNVSLQGKPLAMIPGGTTVQVKSIKGDWMEIRLPDGRSGWVQTVNLEKV